ncbi:hypothetical protein H072_10587 [Dactylellina haptotyla CBS 200.50]|uniref:Uncharacterized protein n=1 Tax=Dactylellina haptotyla (strain CBS 200.50) TaxID=1284197 RepID=S8BL43_DACHA|nr:hypothetical protein H072_10587 [Dactylellina haptotyla CBS 200.50]
MRTSRSRPQLSLLVPPPFHQYAPRSPTYFATLSASPEKTPSPTHIYSASTLTPTGTIIFDSTNLYTPTSPAKPFIYSSYLPTDELSLRKLLNEERSAAFKKTRSKVLVLLYWFIGVCVIVGFWGWSSWCSGFSYRDSNVFDRLFTGSVGHPHHRPSHAPKKEYYTRPPQVKLNENGTEYTITMPIEEELYPLPGQMYADLCTEVNMKSMAAYEQRNGKPMNAHLGYWDVDHGFAGLEFESAFEARDHDKKECGKTLTYVVDDLEGQVGGVGAVVMGMWMAYGVAKTEGREFFVVQGHGKWAYGDIRRYFNVPAASDDCVAPPMSHRLPCPMNTAHKLVTPATFKQAFGHVFENEFEDARAVGVQRQKAIFGFLRTGYEAITLRSDINDTVVKRVKELGISKERGVVAVQVRHGDKHAREWKYHNGYIPVERYLKVAANETGEVASGMYAGTDDGKDKWVKEYQLPEYPDVDCEDFRPLRIISSDDSDVFEDKDVKECAELGQCVRAQDRKVSVGLPGGFWAEDVHNMDKQLNEAEGVAVGYLVDFSVMVQSLAGAKDGWAVCGLDGDMCRMLAVGMGWESAIEKGHWVNIDGDFDWFGIRW